MLRNKAKVMPHISPLSQFSRRFYRACPISWADFFFMGRHETGVVENELDAELMWAKERPSLPRSRDTGNEFEDSVGVMEHSHFICYRIKFGGGYAFQLNQNHEVVFL